MNNPKVLHHVGISGGKDSTALLLWAVHESGLPRESLRASFCDTGNEAEETYAYVRLLSAALLPVEWIKPPLDFYELAAKKGRFPSAKARFCTEELKVRPSAAHVKNLMRDGADVVSLSGVRASESADRAKLPKREWSELFDCEVWRPLLSWSIQEVWDIHARYGIPRNPLYEKGCQRVGCLPCVMSRKEEIFVTARQFPARIACIRESENFIGREKRAPATFFTPNKVPLRYRSKPWTNPKTGEQITLATIDDVVRWAESEHSAKQHQIDFEEIEETPSCASRWGMCE